MDLNLSSSLMAGDPRLIDHIVGQVKSQGIFDQFRKECIADVDTKPAYQNLRTRVEGSVNSFLNKQVWKPEQNKNQLRETLRKHIHDAPYLDAGVERIVDQVVNPKTYSVFMPQIEDVVYKFLGIERPKPKEKNGPCSLKDLLPKDLDPVSPESDRNSLKDVSLESIEDVAQVKNEITNGDDRRTPPIIEKKEEKNEEIEKKEIEVKEEIKEEVMEEKQEEVKTTVVLSQNDSMKSEEKAEEEEEDSPDFEPIDIMNLNESNISNDSHLSGISELTSHRSKSPDFDFGRDNFDVSNQDSQLSKVSSDSRLSIVTDFGSSNQGSNLISDSKDEKIDSKIKEKTVWNFDIETIKSKDNFQEAKEKTKSASHSKESSRDVPDGKERSGSKDKDKNTLNRENSCSKSSSRNKERSSSKDSKNHRDRDKDREKTKDKEREKDKKRHSSSSRSDKSKSKSSSYSNKEKSDDSKESNSSGKSKDIKSEKGDKSERTDKTEKDKKDGSKDVKDLKDIYKEKIRELREKKEMTEKEKLNKISKDSKESKEKKDSSKDKKDYKKDHKSSSNSSSRSSSATKYDEKTNKVLKESSSRSEKDKDKDRSRDRDKSRENKDRNKKYESSDSKKSDKSKSSSDRDDKKVRKDSEKSRYSDKGDKYDDKNKDKSSRDKKGRDDKKRSKDDHSSLRKSSSDRRSTDRDGSNGSGSKNSYKSSNNSNIAVVKTSSTNLNKESNPSSQSSSETSDNIEDIQSIPAKTSQKQSEDTSEQTQVEKIEKVEHSDILTELSLPLKKRPLPEESLSTESSAVKIRKLQSKEEKQPEASENAKIEAEKMEKDSDKMIEKDVSSLPDDERVQIIEVPVEYDDLDTSEDQMTWDLENTPNAILMGDPSFQINVPDKIATKLSQIDASIFNSFKGIMSDEKSLIKNEQSGDFKAPSTSGFSRKSEINDIILNKTKMEQSVTKNKEKITEEVMTKNETSKDIKEKYLSEKTQFKEKTELKQKEENKIEGTTLEVIKSEIPKKKKGRPPKDKGERSKINDDEKERCITKHKEKLDEKGSTSKDVDKLRKTELADSLHHEGEEKSDGEKWYAKDADNSQMAPPSPVSASASRKGTKRSANSPLADMLLNNPNNNNEGLKSESMEMTDEPPQKKKRGRPKKNKDEANSGTSFTNGENFVMPPSPESDVSATSDKATSKEEKSRQRSKQHYTSDDLYKPRPLFSSSSRRNRRSNPA